MFMAFAHIGSIKPSAINRSMTISAIRTCLVLVIKKAHSGQAVGQD
jgi:hypothetical protein